MSDNGAAVLAGEFTEGLARLGILQQTTLPYSPHQNAKQEVCWACIEGRLRAMLNGLTELTLALLNQAPRPGSRASITVRCTAKSGPRR